MNSMVDADHQGKLRSRTRTRSPPPSHGTSYQAIHKPTPQRSLSASRWRQLMVGASSAAGTTAAVVSEESMKCLKYCLSWLHYAVQHIEQQMTLLRNFLVSLATSQPSSANLVTQGAATRSSASVLSSIKKDIIGTLRKVVDVVSRYASTALPQHAKAAVRGSILDLPNRWAALNDIRSTATTPGASPMLSPRDTNGEAPRGQEEVAIRLLSFGQESIDMLHSISSIFSDTVERAEAWLERLRAVRMPGISGSVDPTKEHDMEGIQLPPIRTALGMDPIDSFSSPQTPQAPSQAPSPPQ